MNNLIKLLLIGMITIILSACETNVENADLIYEQKLVIKAFLFAGETPNNISVSLTSPPLSKWNTLNTNIEDAEILIITNGTTFNCKYNSNKKTYYNNELLPIAGQTYHLIVKYKDMTATATTTIPDFEIYDMKYELKGIYLNGHFTYLYEYLISWKINTNSSFTYYNESDTLNYHHYYFDYDFLSYYNKNTDTEFKILASIRANKYNNGDTKYIDSLIRNYKGTFLIRTFDEYLWNYKITRNNNYDNFDIFGTSGTNPAWNIKGDGIGLFIGSNKKEIKL